MERKTTATVTRVSRQWWLKANTKAARLTGADGAQYPHVVTVKYTVNGKAYTKRKYLAPSTLAPTVGSTVTVSYDENNPGKVVIVG